MYVFMHAYALLSLYMLQHYQPTFLCMNCMYGFTHTYILRDLIAPIIMKDLLFVGPTVARAIAERFYNNETYVLGTEQSSTTTTTAMAMVITTLMWLCRDRQPLPLRPRLG